ncbi:hypothetical protein V8F20_005774 [Naviculisporaceae sp. PSN 640]
MSDIEDQLLELAGGDESSDNEEPMDMSRENSRSPSPAPSKAKKDTPARESSSKKTPAKKTKRARSDDGSEDEGEASSVPPSPSSQQSVPMDESDSDDDSFQNKSRSDDEGIKYPIEGLFKDYEDKETIMKLVEIERETILAERREENERIRQNRMLKQLKANQDKDNKKRKASAADLEDAQRKPARVRTKAGETSEKMDSLRRAREERSNRKEQRERENDRRKQRSPSYRRSPGGDDESDIDWDRPKHKSRSPEIKESPPAELRDIERARVGRSGFASVCYTPGFEQALTGCFVRINIGPDPVTRQDVYRMAVIKGFTQKAAYAMPSSSGQQMVVESYVKAAHGKAVREWPFIMCSDSGFTEAEWNRYKTVCVAEGGTIPTKDQMRKKVDDINKLINHVWTEEELTAKFKKQNGLRNKYSGLERDDLLRQLQVAQRKEDDELARQIQEKLDNLEVPKLAFKTSLSPPKKVTSKAPTQQEKLARLNLQNRKINAEEVRKAQRLERQKSRQYDAKLQRGNSNGQDKSKNGTPAPGASTPADESGTKDLAHIAKLKLQSEEKSRIPTIHQPITEDDIIGAMDLDIDVEI